MSRFELKSLYKKDGVSYIRRGAAGQSPAQRYSGGKKVNPEIQDSEIRSLYNAIKNLPGAIDYMSMAMMEPEKRIQRIGNGQIQCNKDRNDFFKAATQFLHDYNTQGNETTA